MLPTDLHPSVLLNRLQSLENRDFISESVPNFQEEPPQEIPPDKEEAVPDFRKSFLDLSKLEHRKQVSGFKMCGKPQKFFIIHYPGGMRGQKFYDDLEVQLSSDSTEILLLPRFGEGLVHRITGRNLFGVFGHLCKSEVMEIGCQVDADKATAVIDSISFYSNEG